MGSCVSIKELDPDRINSAIVLQSKGETARYHGTTERGRFQTLGDANLILTENGIYSQVIGIASCNDRGYLHIPLINITHIREQAWFNGLYRIDRPHFTVTYIVPGKGEYQAGWQMTQSGYDQWHAAIQKLLEEKYTIEID